MKSLVDYINEKAEEELELIDAINYDQFAELLTFLDSDEDMCERRQIISDTFRKNYKENLQKPDIISSVVFQRFIDDLVKLYNSDVDEDNKIELNVSTRKHLEDDISAKMLVKINTQQDNPKPQIDDDSRIYHEGI
jgi:hypothetical protein